MTIRIHFRGFFHCCDSQADTIVTKRNIRLFRTSARPWKNKTFTLHLAIKQFTQSYVITSITACCHQLRNLPAFFGGSNAQNSNYRLQEPLLPIIT